ncbi:MAG TPA: DUF4143 domain-containing protein [Pseudobdellovibrionaceae bacterium]
MFPLTFSEIGSQLKTISELERRLLIGGLPSIFDSKKPFDDFDDYIQLYLNEEIKAEGLVRNHDAFHRFLQVSALTNAKEINISEIRAFLSYCGKKSELFYWRSTSKFEVDLIIKSSTQMWALEIKSKKVITKKERKGLLAFAEDYPKVKKIIVSLEGRHFIDEDKIEIIPIFDFLKMLWADELGFD